MPPRGVTRSTRASSSPKLRCLRPGAWNITIVPISNRIAFDLSIVLSHIVGNFPVADVDDGWFDVLLFAM